MSSVAPTRNPNLSAPKINQETPNEILNKFQNQWWTGLSPENCPGFDAKKQSLLALPQIDLTRASREDILNYFNNTWTLTELLFAGLKTEKAYYQPPYHQLRHPLIFYYGHTAVLFVNKLRLAGVLTASIDLYLEKILETGVDEMSWDDMSKNEMQWPEIKTVHAYRKKVYEIIKKLILESPDLAEKTLEKRGPSSPFWALFMGFEHEKIHFETSSVLIRELPIDWVETPKYWPSLQLGSAKLSTHKPELGRHYQANEWRKQKAQTVHYGKPMSAPTFGWDNEYGKRTVHIKDFAVSENLISNGEYFDFVSSLAYCDDQYWSSEGQLWRKFRNTKRPTFWVAYGPEGLHEYKLRTIFSIVDMPWDWPVEVNFHEAKAYAAWRQKKDKSELVYRLITEPEHVAIRDFSTENPANINFCTSSAWPVTQSTPNKYGVRDVFGNVWQWAEDQFNPLDGFQVHPLYDDFSTPCFDGKHQMILGGSFISCGHEASPWARFHFRPHFYQHSGFRLAKTLDGSSDNGSTKLRQTENYIHPKREQILEQTEKSNWWKHEFRQPLEMAREEKNELWQLAIQNILQYEDTLKNQSPMGLALDPQLNDLPENFHVPYQMTKEFPEHGEGFEKTLKLLMQELAPLGQKPGHPGYMAYVAGAGNAVSNVAQAISQTLNQFTAHFSLSPGLVTLELETIKWLVRMLGYPESTGFGLLTSGGSSANLQALAAARNKILKTTDLAKARFYASAQAHHCIGKALAFLGFPKECLEIISCDEEFRINVDELTTRLETNLSSGLIPVAIVGTAGTTNTGAVDPLDKLAALAEKYKIWFHVDGAYGGFFLLTKSGQQIFKGIEKSDSIVLDPHKSLSVPYGTGCLLVKDRQTLQFDYAGASTYMPPSPAKHIIENREDFADYSPELSRDFRGLRLWLPLKTFGVAPFQLNLQEKFELALDLANEIKIRTDLVLVAKPQLSILCFKHKSSEQTKKLLHLINEKNRTFLTGCELNGQYAIRVCLLGFRSHYAQVQTLLEDLDLALNQLKKAD